MIVYSERSVFKCGHTCKYLLTVVLGNDWKLVQLFIIFEEFHEVNYSSNLVFLSQYIYELYNGNIVSYSRPGEHAFNEEWLKTVLEYKAKLGENLCF